MPNTPLHSGATTGLAYSFAILKLVQDDDGVRGRGDVAEMPFHLK
jgi:hypothetical protein